MSLLDYLNAFMRYVESFPRGVLCLVRCHDIPETIMMCTSTFQTQHQNKYT